MEINNSSLDHLQDCANGLRDLVAEGKLNTALKVATYLQREGQLAILNMKKGELKDFYPKVTALLETLENSNVDSHPKLRHTVAKAARVFAQLAVDRMGEPFPEDVKNELLDKVTPRLKAAKVGEQFALRYELFCLGEAVKGIDTGISLFNLSLAAGVIKGGAELATGNGPGTLLELAKDAFKKMGAMWYPDALRLSWIGQMGKDDAKTFAFFCEQVNEYIDLRCKLVDLQKRHVLIGLADTFAEIAWTSTIGNHRQTAALWIAKLADVTQPRTSLKAVRYRAIEQLVAMKMHHVDSIRALATLQLQSLHKTETKKMIRKLIQTTAGRENTGFRERPELVPPRSTIEQILEDPIESRVGNIHRDLLDGNANVMKKLDELDRSKRSPAELALSIIRLNSSHRNFVGRKAELTQLQNHFFEGTWEHQQSCRVALLCGLGGMGKTELALHFANEWRSQFSFVYTIPAGSAETRAEAYRQLATELKLALEKKDTPGQVRKKLFTFLETTSFEKPYLLLYDNVKETLPLPMRNGYLLLTARNQKFSPKNLKIHKVELLPMEEEAGLALLKKWTGEEDSPEMQELFKKLGGYPLVLAQAGAYIGSNPLRSVAKYVKAHTVPDSASPEERYQKTLAQVLSVSFEALQAESSVAFEWLQVCSYFNPDHIPLSYLEKQISDEAEREKVALALTNCGLMQFENETFSTHRLIQQALQKMDPEGEALKIASALLAGIQFDFAAFANFELLQAQSTVWASHAELVLKFGEQIPAANRVQLLNHMGDFERVIAYRFEKALSHLNQALNIRKKVNGKEHPSVASSLNDIGLTLCALGRDGEALKHYNQALTIEKKAHGEEHPSVAGVLNNIGSALHSLNRPEEALKHYNQTLVIEKKARGKEHPSVATCLNNIGFALRDLGQHGEALEYLNQALTIEKKAYGEEHPSVAISLNNIGNTLDDLGRYEEALEHFKLAIDIKKKVYGDEHPGVAHSLRDIGIALGERGRYEEALEYLNQALTIQRKVYGENHPSVASSLLNIGMVLGGLERHEEALKHLHQALNILKKVHGEEHLDVASSLLDIGLTLSDLDRHEEALNYLYQALTIQRKVCGEGHPNVADSLGKVGFTLSALGQHEEALELYNHALTIYKKAHGEEHPNVATALNNTGIALADLGRHEEALKHYNQALTIQRKVGGEEHPEVAACLNDTGNILNTLKRHKEAMEHHRKALSIRKKVYGNEHSSVAESLNNIGNALASLGRYEEALELIEEALRIQKKIHGIEHPNVAIFFYNLGLVHQQMTRPKKAKECFLQAVAIGEKVLPEDHPHLKLYHEGPATMSSNKKKDCSVM